MHIRTGPYTTANTNLFSGYPKWKFAFPPKTSINKLLLGLYASSSSQFSSAETSYVMGKRQPVLEHSIRAFVDS
jgi:hypothetical protein